MSESKKNVDVIIRARENVAQARAIRRVLAELDMVARVRDGIVTMDYKTAGTLLILARSAASR